MTRINIYQVDEDDGTRTLLGWFDPEKATRFDQGKDWDGNNTVGVITHSQWVDEYLYLTSGGRWVRYNDAHRDHAGPRTYEFIEPEQAREWLIRSEINDEAVTKYFGEMEAERGPGRPEIGGRYTMAYGDELLLRIDQHAQANGIGTRAEAIRQLLTSALDTQPMELVTNVADLRSDSYDDSFTVGYVIPAALSLTEIGEGNERWAETEIRIPAHDDPSEWERGLREALADGSDWTPAGPLMDDGDCVRMLVTRA